MEVNTGHRADMAKSRAVPKLTDAMVRQLVPETGTYIVREKEGATGFGVRVTPTGHKAFVLNYVIAGRERRATIGDYGPWSVVAARSQAYKLIRDIDVGIDPLAEKEQRRSAPKVIDLFERYSAEHLNKGRSERAARDNKSMWVKEILPRLGQVLLLDLTTDHVDRMHRDISASRAYRANRVVEQFRAALGKAVRWGWITANPASGVQTNDEVPRERYASLTELPYLLEALGQHENRSSADAILLLLLTGARKSEVLRACWDQFDFVTGVWTKSANETKQGRLHSVPLNDNALALIRALYTRRTSSKLLFPGKVADRPLEDVRRTWTSVLIDATLKQWNADSEVKKILATFPEKSGKALVSAVIAAAQETNVRIPRPFTDLRRHDLRHTFASLVGNSGQSLPVLGALLGHSSLQSTARYTHFFTDPLRKASNAAFEGLVLGAEADGKTQR